MGMSKQLDERTEPRGQNKSFGDQDIAKESLADKKDGGLGIWGTAEASDQTIGTNFRGDDKEEGMGGRQGA